MFEQYHPLYSKNTYYCKEKALSWILKEKFN